MPQRNYKKNSNRKRSILKEERTFERKSKQNIEDTDDKDTDMECGAVWSRNMDNEERRHKEELRLLKCGLGEEWRKSAGQNIRQMKNYWKRLGGKIPHTHNKNQTKEVDWTHSKSRITVKNGDRRENARKKIKRKTKTNDAGLDDGGRI